VARLKYLGTTLTDQNLIHKKIKSRLNTIRFRNFCLSLLPPKIVNTKTYNNYNFAVVLYWCEIWSLTLREEQSPDKGPKRNKMLEGWRKLHNEELRNLYSSPNRIIRSRKMRLAGYVACTGEKMNAYRILVGKPESKRLIERIWKEVVEA
jgi:hypothetical protein